MLPAKTHQETASAGPQAWHAGSTVPKGVGSSAVQRRMVLLSLLPAGLVAITATAVVVLLRYAGGMTGTVWGLLAGALLLTCVIFTGAAFFAAAEARAIRGRHDELSRFAARGQAELIELLQLIKRGQRPVRRQQEPLPEPMGDALDRLAHEIACAQLAAEAAVVEVATLRHGGDAHNRHDVAGGGEEQVEVFVNLSRRLQSLVHREIGLLDELENEVEDPDLLKGLFHVDHLATRVRRYAENLYVLGGGISRRQWTRPVSVSDVLRSAVAEIEQYLRVKLVPPVEGTLAGHAVVDVVHLVAELAENATVFSPPQTLVLLRVQRVTAGLVIEVEDRGLGMTSAERDKMNSLLAHPHLIAPSELLRDGRIGLYVVSVLARRHGITVELQGNIYGGTQAVLVLPHELLGQQPDAAESWQQPSEATAPGTHGYTYDSAEPTLVPDAPAALGPAAPVAEPPLAPTAVSTPGDIRPSLPKRRRQEHLSPELEEPFHNTGTPDEVEHEPGLMAAFRTGVRQAEDSKETDASAAVGEDNPPGPDR